MMRPPSQPVRGDVSPHELPHYDLVVERERRRGGVGSDGTIAAFNGYYGALLNSPEMSRYIAALGQLVRQVGDRPGSYSHAEREWADHVLCHDWGTNCVMPGHIDDAMFHGVRPEAILALRTDHEDELTDDERQLTDYIRRVVSGAVTDASFDMMEARWGTRGVVEYTIFVSYLAMTMRLYEALTGASGPTNQELVAQVRAYADGTRPLPDSMTIIPG